MNTSKWGFLPMRHGIKLSKKQSPKTGQELKRMSDIPYTFAVGCIQYVIQCTRLDVAYALILTSRYQTCAGEVHWSAVKTILKYLKKTKDMFLIYSGGDLILESYNDASFTMMIPSPNQVCIQAEWWCGCLEKFQAGYHSGFHHGG
ncbi:UNVERIFIED_CONTAM: hypothetical protein Sradi_6145100 [Sesamum radiatum]|uniref:Uncharacterized protein n=1 Tax=Sesamum radiatum TaxID=300843 RepID=A0AAW2KLC9_SESRA